MLKVTIFSNQFTKLINFVNFSERFEDETKKWKITFEEGGERFYIYIGNLAPPALFEGQQGIILKIVTESKKKLDNLDALERIKRSSVGFSILENCPIFLFYIDHVVS